MKIGDNVCVMFHGVLEMEEITDKGGNMCRVTARTDDGRFCIALVAKEFLSECLTTTKKENE